jgi:sulfur carrier protein
MPDDAIQTVRVNDALVPWHDGLDVAAVVAAVGVDPSSIATAVNGAFVPRTLRDATPLRPGDVVLMFQAITGG